MSSFAGARETSAPTFDTDESPPLIPDGDHIVSFAWHQGSLAVAYLQLNTMTVLVTEQTVDLKPDFPFLNNLCRRLTMTYILASGPEPFLRELARLAGLPDNLNLLRHKIEHANNSGSPVFVIYPAENKNHNSSRILTLRPSSMPPALNETESKAWLGTILPLHQPLVVQALGNLLHYFEANGRRITSIANPVIADLNVYRMDSQVLIDNDTLLALQIFSPSEYHPSAFQMGVARNKEGLSVYSLLNRCCSSYGSRELKSMMLQPTRDYAEIKQRLDIIEWSMAGANVSVVQQLRPLLQTMNNVSEIYWRLMQVGSRVSGWKSLQSCVNGLHNICLACVEETKKATTTGAAMEFLQELGAGEPEFKRLANAICRVVDVEQTVNTNRFNVCEGFDDQLDGMKRHVIEINQELRRIVEVEVAHFPDNVAHEVSVKYMETIGFVIAVKLQSADAAPGFIAAVTTPNIRFMFQNVSILHFQTPKSAHFNSIYGEMYVSIFALEQEICQQLLEHIRPGVVATHKIVRKCAQLDCFIALGRSATVLNLVRPAIVAEKSIHITAGRHILFGLAEKQFTANDTAISERDRQLVLILTAPNASGKSVYLKQVALIAYMAHIGSYVAAGEARIGRLDSIFSRMYSLECTHQGGSAFLNDLQQMGRVLASSSSRSLILVDEFGKGTNATEGQALLIACIEHLLKRGPAAPMTLISTHFERVSEMLGALGWMREMTFRCVRREQEGISSTFQLVEGRATGSYAAECSEVKATLKELFSAAGGESFLEGVDVGCPKRKIIFTQCVLKSYQQNGFVDAKELRDILFKRRTPGSDRLPD